MQLEFSKILIFVLIFIFIYFVPFSDQYISNALLEGFFMLQDYVREHTLTCLIPALFIAGLMSVKVSQASVIKYFGAETNKIISYGIASISGTILAVCSCTILPLFTSIYKRGAGLGPAIAFVYSGPAINLLAIVLTAKVLGIEMGIARALGAILFSIVIGYIMAILFKKEEKHRQDNIINQKIISYNMNEKNAWKTILLFIFLIGVLIFATWSKSFSENSFNLWVYKNKWFLTILSIIGVVITSFISITKDEFNSWMYETYDNAKQIMPLLFVGVWVAGFFLGRPGHEGIIPSKYVIELVGGNSFFSNLFSSVIGAFMYFATLTEIPILQSLIGSGMGKGPALALLLSGPALSLPNMLVIKSVIGTWKTFVYVLLVIVMSTMAGIIYGNL